MDWELQNKDAKTMFRIDAHHHLWKYDPVRDAWITNEMTAIKKDFLPEDFRKILLKNNFDGSIVVQSDQSEIESKFLLDAARHYDFIKGVVGWIDLQAENVGERLASYSSFKKMKGFRHVLQSESDRRFMLRPAFLRGVSKLKKFGFTYDILIFADQLKFVPEFVAAFPDQKFVVDHIAKPMIRDKKIDEWKKEIGNVAHHQNVFCKISGMVTEADWKNWKQEDLVPYIDVVVESFGTGRIMFGSDWPVCLLAATYEQVWDVVHEYFSEFSQSERELFFGGNATQFYNL
jgi:L-fuconolactonase